MIGFYEQKWGIFRVLIIGPEFPLMLDLAVVAAISLIMITLAALSFRRKE